MTEIVKFHSIRLRLETAYILLSSMTLVCVTVSTIYIQLNQLINSVVQKPFTGSSNANGHLDCQLLQHVVLALAKTLVILKDLPATNNVHMGCLPGLFLTLDILKFSTAYVRNDTKKHVLSKNEISRKKKMLFTAVL